jgi:hypothetical protein
MSKALGLVAFIVALAAIAEGAYIASARARITQLQERLDRIEARQRDLASRSDVERVDERIAKVESDGVQARRTPPPAPTPTADPAAPLPASVSPDDIAAMIDRKVEEKVKAKGEENGFGGKKRPLNDVAKELGLSTETQMAMAAIVNEGKTASFDVLKTLRDDGRNLVDDIIDAIKSPENPQEKMQQQFMRIFKEQVPGTQETYFAAVIKVSDTILKKFENVLTPEQIAKFKHTGVGPLDLETGFDPFAEYMKGK